MSMSINELIMEADWAILETEFDTAVSYLDDAAVILEEYLNLLPKYLWGTQIDILYTASIIADRYWYLDENIAAYNLLRTAFEAGRKSPLIKHMPNGTNPLEEILDLKHQVSTGYDS